MNTYKRHRSPPDIIGHSVWLYYRFNLSRRRCAGPFIEDLLAERGITVSRERFFKRLLRSHGSEPRKIVTDKLRSYGVAHRELIPEVIHDSTRYSNDRAEQSHEATRVRERGMRGTASRKFKSTMQAQRFLTTHAAVYNLFNLGRHLVRAQYYRNLRTSAFVDWAAAVA